MPATTTGLPETAPARSAASAIPVPGPMVHAALRVGAGLLFMQHGAQKLFGLLGGIDGNGASAELFSQYGLAGALELFGGALIVAGLFTRPVAAGLALLMVVAYFVGHGHQGGFPIQSGGELALLYALVFAFLAGNGAGAWSLDRRRAA